MFQTDHSGWARKEAYLVIVSLWILNLSVPWWKCSCLSWSLSKAGTKVDYIQYLLCCEDNWWCLCFHHIWFGSFLLERMDSRRLQMQPIRLNLPKEFLYAILDFYTSFTNTPYMSRSCRISILFSCVKFLPLQYLDLACFQKSTFRRILLVFSVAGQFWYLSDLLRRWWKTHSHRFES